MALENYKNDIYAGVLGKIIGVYLGRPVEGWTFENIKNTFGKVSYYKNHKTGAPLIVPDDDISGTFAFFRALEDSGYKENISAEEIGDAWLNYIVENETILWWGGLCRSTEHTAYLRLKNGIKAPMSGSIALNGQSMAEQIGAEIFIDTWAMVNPGNPERACEMARKAASVSHDGVAVDAAVYLAAMEAMAFEEKDIDKLLDKGLTYIDNEEFKSLIAELREKCAKASDWYEVRQWIADEHGYDKYPGNCPMITNHLTLLMAFIMGGDDFQKACMIACSAGWDTDCNSGNVGCLNGIRLGLDGFTKGADLRKPVADRLYVVTSDGGSCISDAVIETRKILKAAAKLNGEEIKLPEERLAFEYPGSVQGIVPYDKDCEEQVLTKIENSYETTGEYGCRICYEGLARGVHASVAIDTFIDLKPKGKEGTSYFDVLCSPTLYSGQDICLVVDALNDKNPKLELFFEYFDENDFLENIYCGKHGLNQGRNILHLNVPDTQGHPIFRVGICLTSEERLDGSIIVKSIDWANTPEKYKMGRSMDMTPTLTPWTTTTSWLKTFVSSADHFNPDYTVTFSICNAVKNGVVTTGTSDWKDYAVKSIITFSQQESAGLVARAKGHRRYYGAVLTENSAIIYKQQNEKRIEVARAPFNYLIDHTYELEFDVKADNLIMKIDGSIVVRGKDSEYKNGQAGFVVDTGAILGDGFEICRL